ncbi:hypothetical protein [Comamonas testosteroni]|uniref:hypothetical protein n=1 Tax=Comamonas testosteroni TaxID=285 RepID=UPI00391A043C
MKHGKALLAGLFAGLAAPSTIAFTPRYHELQGSDLQRIRGDAVRVGNTFKYVIARESSKKAKPNS